MAEPVSDRRGFLKVTGLALAGALLVLSGTVFAADGRTVLSGVTV